MVLIYLYLSKNGINISNSFYFRNNQQIINSTLAVPFNENAVRSSSIVSLGPEGNRLPLIVKGNKNQEICFSINELPLVDSWSI